MGNYWSAAPQPECQVTKEMDDDEVIGVKVTFQVAGNEFWGCLKPKRVDALIKALQNKTDFEGYSKADHRMFSIRGDRILLAVTDEGDEAGSSLSLSLFAQPLLAALLK